MKSITLFTEEVDDVVAGVNDLLDQMEDFTLLTNSVGLLFVPPDVELEYLTELLWERLGFPVIGATGMAVLNDKCGFQDSGLSLQIMTADDCSFSVGATGRVNEQNLEAEICSLCSRLKVEAEDEPKLVLTYAAVLQNISGERYMRALQSQLPGLPIYGGSAADDFSFEDTKVFYGTEICSSGAVVLLVCGNVRPVMHCAYSVSRETLLPGEAKCEHGVVKTLGDRTLIEALQTTGIRSEKQDVVEEFVGMPFVADMPTPDGDHLRLVRHLLHLDHETGSGTFLGEIVDGTRFAISILDKDYLCASVERGFSKVLTQLEQAEDYRYSTIICTSCSARHMVLTGSPSDEGDAIMALLPGNLSLNGFYSFGEICPVESSGGKEYNAFHNTAFTILAL